MAGGNLGIEEVTDLYERAGRLHAQATERLAAISARIEKLTGPPATSS
jgi:exonuclease VII small subunit